MPMIWNAQTDAQLLVAIIQVYDVKVTGEKLSEVAKLMGEGCTAKALTHRISKIKNMAKTGTLDGSEKTEETGKKTEETGKKTGETGKKPPAAKGKGKGGKAAARKADTPVDGGDDDSEVEKEAKPKKAAACKRKKEEAGEDEESKEKKVKLEEENAEDAF